MINVPLLLISLLIPLAYGLLLSRLILRGLPVSRGLVWGISYGTGLGVLCVWMMVLKWMGVPYSFWSIILPPPVLLGIAYRYVRPCIGVTPSTPPLSKKDRPLYWLTGLVGALIVFLVFWHHTQLPVRGWDSLATASLNAKALYFSGGRVPLNHLIHADYPLFVSLAQCWLALAHHGWSEFAIRYAFPWMFCAFVLLQFDWVRNKAGARAAAVSLLLLLSSHTLYTMATLTYREIFMMYFTSGTFLLLISWQDSEEEKWLWLASVFGALMLFTKSEGLIYLAVQAVLVGIILYKRRQALSRKISALGVFLSCPLVMLLALNVFKRMHHVTAVPLTFPETILSLDRLLLVGRSFLEMTVLSHNWNIVWIIGAGCIVMFRRRHTFSIVLLEIAVALILGTYFLGAMTTDIFFTALATSHQVLDFPRLLLHFYPLLPVIIALLMFGDEKASVQ